MPTSDERARVARALREMEKPTWPTLTEAVMGHVATREKVVERLADLIEPSCDASATVTDASATRGMSQTCRSVDRHALLKLADRIQHHADNAAGHSAYAARFDLAGWAEVIREACSSVQED